MQNTAKTSLVDLIENVSVRVTLPLYQPRRAQD